jgi:hypothetical protein
MGVKYTHPEYDEMLPIWEKCEDVAEGTASVRAKKTKYLPKLEDEDDTQYLARLNRTVLYNATWRTVVGFLGLLFKKPPVLLTKSEKLKEMAKDITLSGVSLGIFALEVCEECLVKGRLGIWVNYPVTPPGFTLADVKLLNLRPSMHKVEAENIRNWKTMRIDNQEVLSQVVIAECKAVPEDEFKDSYLETWRVLDLVYIPDTKEYVYRVRVFKVNDKDEDVLIEGPFYPMMNGKFMNRIPFVFVSPDDTTPDVDEPPFVDLVDVNLAHYQVTADYENGCHWSGIPTMWVTGHEMDGDDDKLAVGGSALVFPQATTRVGLVEVGAGGFTALEKNLDRKESQMVILGARLLEVQKPGIEAAETAQIHRSGEQSILASMAGATSEGITKALNIFQEWMG